MSDTDARKAKKKKHKKLKKLMISVALLAAAGVAAYLFVLPRLAAGATTTYDSYSATTGTISNSMSFSGSISVKNYETLSASSECIVRKIYVAESQDVETGDKLMRLSTGETLKASFDGQVNEIAVAEGDAVSANANLIQIVDFSNMKVSLRVDEYGISKVYVGQMCRVTVTALGLTYDSRITHINRISASGGSTAYYTVTAELSVTGEVLPGMQVSVVIPEDEAVDAVIISRAALSFDRSNSAYVIVRGESGEMEQKHVELGVDNDNYVQIKSGLSAGDTVYKVAEASKDGGGGLLSGLTSLFGGGNDDTKTQQQSGYTGYPGRDGGYPGWNRNAGGMGGGRLP